MDEYRDPETSVAFFRQYLQVALPHLQPNAPIYQWHADRRKDLVLQAWREAGLLMHQTIVWVKPRAILTHSHFMWGFEPCFYGWVEGHPPKRRPPSDQSNVWQIPGEHDNIHPTQKPLALFERPMAWHTESDDICLEPFSGSGTHLIAAERLGRRCYAMEREPRYVDINLARWESFTGEKATKA